MFLFYIRTRQTLYTSVTRDRSVNVMQGKSPYKSFKRPIHSQTEWFCCVTSYLQKNWVNCAVLTGNSAGPRTVLSGRFSQRELGSSLRESYSFLSLPADTTMASSQGTQFIQQMSIAWYVPFQIPLLTPHFTLSFSAFRIALWPMWLANSKRRPCFYPP
jgi:hypothetical protein